jgi:hypothetical protein
MKKVFFAIIIAVTIVTGCKKEDSIVPTSPIPQSQGPAFKQTVWISEEGNCIIDTVNDIVVGGVLYKRLNYTIATVEGEQMEEITFTITIVMNDSAKVILTERDMEMVDEKVSASQPKRIISFKDRIPSDCLLFDENIIRFEYEANVKVEGKFYTIRGSEIVDSMPEEFPEDFH